MSKSSENQKREDFLIVMYGHMWQNIERHILIVWQSISVLAGVIAVFALGEKGVISPDISVTLIVLIATWLIANILDASGWYNRNLVIIANIERQFLTKQDLCDVYHYFGKHQKNMKLIEHLQVQFWFGVVIAGFFLLHHLFMRTIPAICSLSSKSNLPRLLPYTIAIIASIVLYSFWKKQCESHKTLLEKSPGVQMETEEN